MVGIIFNLIVVILCFIFKINQIILESNLFLLVFNIMPIYPLDGANALMELVKLKYDDEYTIDIIFLISIIFCIILIFFFIIIKMYLYLLFVLYFLYNLKKIKNIKENYYLDKIMLLKM